MHERHGGGRAPRGRVEAHQAEVPLVVCTADRPPELREVAAPQTIDQLGLYGSAVRYAADPGPPDAAMAGRWRSLVSRALADAVGPWPGPVHLNLPFRDPLVGGAGRAATRTARRPAVVPGGQRSARARPGISSTRWRSASTSSAG